MYRIIGISLTLITTVTVHICSQFALAGGHLITNMLALQHVVLFPCCSTSV